MQPLKYLLSDRCRPAGGEIGEKDTHRQQKAKIDKGDCPKLKSFYTAKETINRVTGNLPNERKYLQTTHLIRG